MPTPLRTHSNTAEVAGAITRSEPETDETSMRDDHGYVLKGVQLETPKVVRPAKSLAWVGGIDMRHNPAKQLCKNSWTRYTGGNSPVHDVNKFVDKTQHVAGKRTVGGHSRPQHFGEGAIPTRHPVGRLVGDTGTIAPGNNSPKSVLDAPDKALRFHACVGACAEWQHGGYRLQLSNVYLDVPTLNDDYTVTGRIIHGIDISRRHRL